MQQLWFGIELGLSIGRIIVAILNEVKKENKDNKD